MRVYQIWIFASTSDRKGKFRIVRCDLYLRVLKSIVDMSSKDLRTAYHPNYFSVENILASQTLIPCRTEMRLPKFGFLVPDCNSEDLPVGINLELPIWAARVLCRPLRTYVSVNIPPGFKEAHRECNELWIFLMIGNCREVFKEDPTVDLKKVNTNYYETGHLCTALFHNDAGELAEMLPEVLQQRILCIGSAVGATVRRNSPLHGEMMDILEEKLFKDSQESRIKLDDWLQPFELPPEVKEELRRPKPPPPSPPKQHHQQYLHRPFANQLPPAPAHSQLPPPVYGNPYAQLHQSGHPSPYGSMNMSSHQGLGMQNQNTSLQHQGHGQVQSHNHSHYSQQSHNMYMK
ncbi:DNA replication complex GINS protein PSF3 [Orchesella cincta]|uniref:DNA replication complex GINS protein PSF3 n=1 Tax=Orchesella cincta TaxID=48709 RepID=A0A1D2MPK6_ORCCI|nr:DNA replication complex GINS protein PSF3 [Orchesella cincta]